MSSARVQQKPRSRKRFFDISAAPPPPNCAIYERGLVNVDSLARRRHAQRFLALGVPEQIALLAEIDGLSTPVARWGGKAAARLLRLYRVVRFPAAQLFPILVEDVMREFYTSPVAWVWLSYDGPPMPRGYLDVLEPRV